MTDGILTPDPSGRIRRPGVSRLGTSPPDEPPGRRRSQRRVRPHPRRDVELETLSSSAKNPLRRRTRMKTIPSVEDRALIARFDEIQVARQENGSHTMTALWRGTFVQIIGRGSSAVEAAESFCQQIRTSATWSSIEGPR